jgi:hypothetical protein
MKLGNTYSFCLHCISSTLLIVLYPRSQSEKIKIVHCCGFDSVPSDLGTYTIVQEMLKRDISPIEVKYFVKFKAGISGGTIASAFNIFADKEAFLSVMSPFCLTPSPPPGASRPLSTAAGDNNVPAYDRYYKVWTVPFFLQGLVCMATLHLHLFG